VDPPPAGIQLLADKLKKMNAHDWLAKASEKLAGYEDDPDVPVAFWELKQLQ
jgi:hypothetical protein